MFYWKVVWLHLQTCSPKCIQSSSYGEVYRGDWHGTEVAVKKFLDQDLTVSFMASIHSFSFWSLILHITYSRH
ncbi:hypothetical protein ACJIZ3_023569 [Penstemon smallii]|uniref:Uncharacterized protein n=1 Tax=Penstemon smallii TaxID=265156 RepID=A0ABD3TRX0_9LAMI